MTTSTRRQPFTRVDTAWLRMEDPTNLMMACGMMLFPRPLPLEDLRRVFDERLDLFPRFRMRVVEAPLGIGSPTWELDPNFDLDAHLHHVALPAPGGQKELQALVSDIVSTPLDFTKPPWQLHLVDGFEGGSALISRVHHCIADGMALIQVLWLLTDNAPRAGSEANGRHHHDGAGPAAGGSMLLRAAETLLHPRQVVEVAGAVLSGTRATLGLTIAPPDNRTVLKGPLGVAKRTAWTDGHSLAELKRTARAHGATLNDVLTAVVAGGLGAYLRGRRIDVGTAVVRAAIPVNLRGAGPVTTSGNAFGLVYLELPLHIPSPTARIAEVRRRMTTLKKSHLAEASLLMLGAFGTLPAWLQPLAINFFGLKASLTLTNVPGPRSARYLAGHRVGDVMFWGPTSGRLSLGISVLTYAGHIRIGVITDAGLVPDPERIAELVEVELGRLRSEQDGAPGVRRAPNAARRAAVAG